MTIVLSTLAERIRLEIADLELTVDRAMTGVVRAKQYQDDIYLDAIALNLHAFYTGMERLFEKSPLLWMGNCRKEQIGTRSCWYRWAGKYPVCVLPSFQKKFLYFWMSTVDSGMLSGIFTHTSLILFE